MELQEDYLEYEIHQVELLDDCRVPFTPCWCERRPNNPHCQDQAVNASIESDLFIPLLLIGILIFIKRKL